ncbi:hypothetical protein KUL42_01630 [Alteromonas sp. KUL42]|uniref:ADP-ribosylglycohydrolase n=1 Tax=Alteromonas sp. KUL42 TaxID=2480797 RepID=UPI0007939BCD|nr:ADP-ribosylglycohydrolase [Alteromonas sp. KUL42]KXJ61162.1 MAG: ADP-ribosylglycohydrolase [Alteromonas sp. Nap_26]TAP38183.1 ADP-ribosylglycohydrolase [Alteromonas sp. KUL42]GEA05402.1 hypothetical protein KUL42_01630 [Alteromonas sp. KUL42]
MYKGHCHCQAIQFEIDHIDELDADNERIANSDNQSLRLEVNKEVLVIDCAPSALAKLHVPNGETHHMCNICGHLMFVETSAKKVIVDVFFNGHDALSEPHCQFVV